MLRSLWRSLFRRPAARPVTRKPLRPQARLGLGALEDRLAPANVAFVGGVLTFTLDQPNEQLSLQLNATSNIQVTTSATFSGVLGGNSAAVIGFNNWAINDSAAGTSVAYLNGGAFSYDATFNVTLDSASNGISFAGTQKFGGFAQNFTSDKLITASAGSALSTTGQPVTMTTDSLTLTGTLNAGASSVTLRPFSAGTQVALGGADGAGTLGVDQAEINNVTAGTLTVGRNDIATGSVNVSAAVAVPATVGTLSVVTARNIVVANPLTTVDSNISLSANRQAAKTAGDFSGITVDPTASISATGKGAIDLAGRGGDDATTGTHLGVLIFGGVTATTGNITITGTGGVGTGPNNLGVAIAGPTSVVSTTTGDISIKATSVTVSFAFGTQVSAGGIKTTGGDLTITSNSMQIDSNIDVAAGSVTLATETAVPINIGSLDTAGSLGLTDAELDLIAAGLLQIGDAVSGTITVGADVTRPGNLTLKTGAGVTGSANLLVGSAGGTTLTIDQAGTSTYSGSIGGAGSANEKKSAFVNAGPGTLKLAGANTYSGTTTVNNGTLLVNGSIASTAGTTVVGGTLGGTGSIANSVTVQTGATLSPGDGGVGTLTITGLNLNLQAGSTFLVDIGPGTAADRVNVANYNIGNGAKLIGTPVQTPLASAPYQLIGNSSSGAISGAGFLDVNGKTMPPVTGGPVEVGGAPFFYLYQAAGFRLTAGSTSVSVDGAGNLNIDDLLDKNDDLRITRVGANIRIFDPNNTLVAGAGATQVNNNTVDVPFVSVTGKINVTTKAGDDSLTLNLAGGILPAGGLDFDGGAAGDDALSVVGSGSETATYTPDAAVTGKGTVQIAGVSTISFTGLEPTDISGMALATLALAGADDVLDIANGFDDKTGAIPALVVSGTSAGVAIESAHFFNNTTVVIDTTVVAGNDTITITSANNAHANANLTIKTGTGADSLAVNGQVLLTGVADFQAATMSFAATADLISADKLALLAVNGIGSLAAPVLTDVNSLEALTTSGGIFITNNAVTAGTLNIGGVPATFDGVRATTSGDIQLINSGTILLNGNSSEDIRTANGNVLVQAIGVTADVEVRNDSADAIDSDLGNVSIDAGRDILLGSATDDDFGDIEANGNITLTAVRDIIIDENTDVEAFGTGSIVANAGANFSIVATDGTTGSSITTQGGSISLTSDSFTLAALTSISSNLTASPDGAITISADNMSIAGTINAGTAVASLRQEDKTARPISLGGGAAAGALGLSDAELALVTAGVLRIGRTDNTGAIDVDGQVTAHAGYSTLHLLTGGAITDGNAAGNDIEVTNLAITSDGDVGTGANPLETKVSNLAWDTGVGSIDLFNAGALTITTVDAVVGGSGDGHASVTASSPETVAANVIMGGNITLTAGEIDDDPVCADDLTVNAGVTVQSTGGDVNLRAGDDLILTAGSTVQAAAAVRLIAGFGDLDDCGAITFGGAIIAGTNLAICSEENLTIGALTAPGTVTLRSVNGAIIDGNGAANNVTAAALAMQANTGIGVGDSLETDVDNVEALTDTGGIFLDNTGNLTIGNVTPDAECITVTLTGLRVTTSGDIQVTNSGSIFLADTNGTEIVRSGANSGNVVLTANGATSDVSATVNRDAITAPAGDITVTAGQDILLGTAGANFDNDVRANGSITFDAGRDIIVDGFADIAADDFGNATGGSVTFTADRHITLGPSAGNDVSVTARAGNVDLTTGANGVFTLTNGAVVSTTGGDITVTADDVVIGSTSSINAAAGCVTIRQFSAAQEIDLGGAGGAGTIGLTDAELDRITTTSPTGGLVIGRNDAGFTGDITVSAAINQAGSGYTTMVLTTAGDITELAGGTLTVANLALTVGGSVSMAEANGVTTLAGTSGKSFEFANAIALTVGTVAACGTNFVGVVAGPGPDPVADVTLCSTAGISLTAAVTTTTGSVRIQAGGNVTQTAAGLITALNLGVRAAGNIDLGVVGSPNSISGVFAATTAGGPAGSFVHFLNDGSTTIGTVTALGCFTTDVVGVTANDAEIDLVNTAGSLTIQQPINAGTAAASIVRINSAVAVSQSAGGAGAITARDLAVVANGNVDLCQVANTVSGKFAASNTLAGAFVRFLNSAAFAVDTVAADAFAAGAIGITTNNGDVSLKTTGGTSTVTLTQAINTGAASTATVRIESGSAVTQTGGGAGAITAQDLAVVANGNVDLCQVANNISRNFAANNTLAGAFVRFFNTPGITVDAVAADACAAGATGVVTNNGDVSLKSTNGPITLTEAINTGAASTATVRIQSGAAVNQTAGGNGAITARDLSVVANGNVDLCDVANSISRTFAANNTLANAIVHFFNTPGFTVDAVAADVCAAGATGVVTTNGDVSLESTNGPITLDEAINTGAASTATVRIESGAGVNQTAGGNGAITAQDLAVVANGNVDLCEVANSISRTFAANNTLANAIVHFFNTPGFTVDAVAADVCAAGATGVVTTNGDVSLKSTNGPIALTEAINTGAASTATVRIQSGAGVNQTVGGNGAITARDLAVNAAGAVDLCDVANNISRTFAANNTLANAIVHFFNTPGFTVGSVAADGCATGATGVVTTNGNASLKSTSGPIRLADIVTVGTGTVRLQSGGADATGSVYQTGAGAGKITAFDLSVQAVGNIDLAQTANEVTEDVALRGTQSATSISYTDLTGFRVGQVADDVCALGAKGIEASNSNGVIRLTASGPVSEDPAVGITGDTLRIEGPASYTLGSTLNDVAKFTAGNVTRTGAITYTDASDLKIVGDGANKGILTNNAQIQLNVGLNFEFVNQTIDVGNASGEIRFGVNEVGLDGTPGVGANLQGTVIAGNGVNTFLNVVGNNRSNDVTVSFTMAANQSVVLYGQLPTPAQVGPGIPGDSLFLVTGPNVAMSVVEAPPGSGNGFIIVKQPMQPDRQIPFISFERLKNRVSFQANVILTNGRNNPADPFNVEIRGQVEGFSAQGAISGQVPAVAPFVASPQFRNPLGVYSAPQITFGNVNGDFFPDIIIGNGADTSPAITILDGAQFFGFNQPTRLEDAKVLSRFFAYDPTFYGGVYVATGDVNGDGRVEIITGAGEGGGPHVKVFTVSAANPANVSVLSEFFAFAPNFLGGVRVAAGRVDGDVSADVVTAAGPGGGPHVKVFNGASLSAGGQNLVGEFFAYNAGFRGGVYVDAGDYGSMPGGVPSNVLDGRADILTGAGFGGGPHLRVFDGATVPTNNPLVRDEFFDDVPVNPVQSPFQEDIRTVLQAGVTGVAFTDGFDLATGAFGDPTDQLQIAVGSGVGRRTKVRVYARQPGNTNAQLLAGAVPLVGNYDQFTTGVNVGNSLASLLQQ